MEEIWTSDESDDSLCESDQIHPIPMKSKGQFFVSVHTALFVLESYFQNFCISSIFYDSLYQVLCRDPGKGF